MPIKYLLDTILVIVSDIDDAPLQLKSLVILKALGTSSTFINQVSKHYVASGKRQILGLVGSIGILGNPTGLGKFLFFRPLSFSSGLICVFPLLS